MPAFGWFKASSSVGSDPDTLRLAARLRIPKYQAAGLIVMVDAHMASHQTDGDLDAVADLFPLLFGDFTGDQEELRSALLSVLANDMGHYVGFLERNAGAFAAAEAARQRSASWRAGRRSPTE